MKRAVPQSPEAFEKVPEEPADYLWGAILASKRWWWLPVVFSIVEIVRSSAFSLLVFATLAVMARIFLGFLGFLAPVSLATTLFLGGALACGYTVIALATALLWSANWGTFAKMAKGETPQPFDHAADLIVDGAIGRIAVSSARAFATMVFCTGMLAIVLWYRAIEPVGLAETLRFALPMTFGLIASSFIGLVVGLVGSQVPIVRFSERCSWPASVFGAVRFTTQNVELIYRIFVTSLLAVFPALVLLYFAVFLQSIAVEVPQMLGIAATVRGFANLLFSGAMYAGVPPITPMGTASPRTKN